MLGDVTVKWEQPTVPVGTCRYSYFTEPFDRLTKSPVCGIDGLHSLGFWMDVAVMITTLLSESGFRRR